MDINVNGNDYKRTKQKNALLRSSEARNSRGQNLRNHLSLVSEVHIYFTRTCLTYTSLYITTVITETTHTNIHSLEHSTT